MTATTTPHEVNRVPKTVNVDLNVLRQKKLMIATPMYGGQCYGQYTRALYNTAVKASQLGVQVTPFFIYNETLIQRARNYCVEAFLQSDNTHLLFIDADIAWNVDELFMMLNLCNADDHQIVCGPYPKKEIAWEKIKRAVDIGAANEDPNNLSNFVGDFVFNTSSNTAIIMDDEFKVNEAGTGFMMVHRAAFEKIAAKYPKKTYKPDHLRSDMFDGKKEIYIYFDCAVDPQSKRYLSEDYYFCHQASKAGIDIWMCPWVQLTHTGTFEFAGTLAHLASVGAHMTSGDHKKAQQ